MSVCVLSHDGEIVLHRHRKAAPEAFLQAVAPSREGLVVAVEGLCTWSWLAAWGAEQGSPCVLGHALSMNAIHGGKATHDTIDSHQMAALLRGGMRPQASVDPAQRRATRDRLRRRTPLMRQRSARLSHVQQPHSQDHLPAIGQQMAYQAHREGGAERVIDPAVPKTLEVDLALIPHDDTLLKDLELSSLTTAKPHDATTLSLVHPVPGIGTLLSLVLRDDIHQIDRFPRVRDVASSARLVTCRQASGGQCLGTSGQTIGHAHRKWALSAAAP
jgi:transposase